MTCIEPKCNNATARGKARCEPCLKHRREIQRKYRIGKTAYISKNFKSQGDWQCANCGEKRNTRLDKVCYVCGEARNT